MTTLRVEVSSNEDNADDIVGNIIRKIFGMSVMMIMTIKYVSKSSPIPTLKKMVSGYAY